MAKPCMLMEVCIWLTKQVFKLLKIYNKRDQYVRRRFKQSKKIVADHLGIDEAKVTEVKFY